MSRAFVFAVALACGLAAAVLLAGPERLPVLAHVEFLPYPVFLVPALMALAASVGLSWRWRFAAAASVAAVVLVVMDFTWAFGDEGATRLRVMTFNVKDYETLDIEGGAAEIEREVARFDPDIVAMQDAGEIGDLVRSGAAFKGRHAYESGEYVVVSRYPLAACGDFVEKVAGKSLAHVRCMVQGPDWRVQLHVAHLVSPRRGLNALREQAVGGLDRWSDNVNARMNQARALAAFVRFGATGAEPVLLMGDLNAPAHSMVLREMGGAGLRDAFKSAGRGFGFTYGHRLRLGISFLRLDHVMVDGSLGVAECFVAPAGISPHRAVVADLVLRRAD